MKCLRLLKFTSVQQNSSYAFIHRNKMSSLSNISIKLKQGTIVGQENKLLNGQPYYAFKGIPYAVPPLDSLRFKPPVPLEKFPQEILDCTREGDVSFHKDPFTSKLVGSENCLFLNVYTPKLNSTSPSSSTEKSLPVMVYIHGGGFLMGSGNSDFHLPLRLIQEDVIVVTLNYRLGILGFLYLPDADIQGNVGLKDQLMALKWVHENINRFNGDPNNVTLFGHSAGSASVHLHLLSPLSRQYFHKAICQSGTANMEWAIQNNPLPKTKRLAELLGCKSTNPIEIGNFLRDYGNIKDMLKHLLNTLTPDERRRGLPLSFKPVIENESNEAIVTKPPLEALSELNTIDKPVMMGYTSKESITMLVNAATKLDELDKDLARLIPRSINVEPTDPRCIEIANEIRKFYFNGRKIDNTVLNELVDLLTDYHFSIGLNIAAEIHARKQHKSPLYFYRFSYDGGLNMFKKWFQFKQIKGTCHGDELFYLFQTEFTKPPIENSNDDLMMKRMCRMWTNFAKYSNPTQSSHDDKLLGFTWDPVKNTSDNEENSRFVLDYLEINENPRMCQDPDKSRIDFWRMMFKKWNHSFLKPKL